MNAFIGWSGQRGLAIAMAVKAWLGLVVPELNVFISPDLPKGEEWFRALARELKEAQIGLMCLSPPNVAGEWQLIEAGAIWKASRGGGLYPLYIGIEGAEVPAPLRAFQATRFERDDFRHLANDLVRNAAAGAPWTEARERAFGEAWPVLQAAVDTALRQADPDVHTPRGFIRAVTGGWWERVHAETDTTKLSWMELIRSADGARLSIRGRGFDAQGQFAADWHTEFLSVDDVSGDQAHLRYYWEGRHSRGSKLLFGGVGRLTFAMGADHRVVTGNGEFSDVCLSSGGEPTVKLVDLRRAGAEEEAVMGGTDASARSALLRRTLDAWP